jgi:hypothetical protein
MSDKKKDKVKVIRTHHAIERSLDLHPAVPFVGVSFDDSNDSRPHKVTHKVRIRPALLGDEHSNLTEFKMEILED